MNHKKILLLLLFLLILSLPLVSSTTASVDVTENKQLAFTLLSDEVGSFLTSITIYDQKSKIIYESESNIEYTKEPSFQMINCRDCKAGSYLVLISIDGNSTQTSFDISDDSFDLFWIIAIVLLVALAFFALFFLKSKKIVESKFVKKESKTKKNSKPKKKSAKK